MNNDTLNIPVFLRRYQPKGGMCAGCAERLNDCSELDFAMMPVIERDGNLSIVKCTEYVRPNDRHHQPRFLRSGA